MSRRLANPAAAGYDVLGDPMPSDVQHPGLTLLERYLLPLDITPGDLAESLGLDLQRVSQLLAGRRPITPDTAARLALFFDVPAGWWLELQARYDAAHLGDLEALRDVVTPYEGLSDILVTPRGVKLLGAAEGVPAKTSMEKVSEDFVARLCAQVELEEDDSPRTVSRITFDDGTVALIGD